MIAVLSIFIVVVALSLFLTNRSENRSIVTTIDGKVDAVNTIDCTEGEIHTDEQGQYKLVEVAREIPRRTYIKALLHGKYWGEIDEVYSNQFEHSRFFDFHIYEVELKNAVYQRVPFEVAQNLRIPSERLPRLLQTILEEDGKVFEIYLHEPAFCSEVKINRKLHQEDGKEVFGTVESHITGYVLDFTREVYLRKEYLGTHEKDIPNPVDEEPLLIKTNDPTGNVEYDGNYKRKEFFYSDYKKTYWGAWTFTDPPTTSFLKGCSSSVIGFLLVITGIVFIMMFLPNIAEICLVLLILLLLKLIPNRFYIWLLNNLSVLFILVFIASLLHIFYFDDLQTKLPKPLIEDQSEELETRMEPSIDTIGSTAIIDTLIKHFRVWYDYEGSKYEGIIWIRKSDFVRSKHFKDNLISDSNSAESYDYMIHSLREYDKNRLSGVYQLFDSIRQENQLSNVGFAELIVSFVQDIPYSVVVPYDCDPNSYEDEAIKEYLSSENARCDGFEKFGINSPVEFMSTLNGDCDTRSLLLYTMLAHYGFDVALFTSEYYAHSIIGLNLPISGLAYRHNNQRYVLWETTAPNFRAGFLPKEIANLNYWRISLKSK